jgi:Phytanoyl-CoA dioxygenase (PhyH)
MQDADLWSAFGDDSSKSDNDEHTVPESGTAATTTTTTTLTIQDGVVSHLVQRLLKWDASVSLAHRRVGILTGTRHCAAINNGSTNDALTDDVQLQQWKKALSKKQIQQVEVLTMNNLRAAPMNAFHNDEPTLDAVIWLAESDQTHRTELDPRDESQTVWEGLSNVLIPGGILLCAQRVPATRHCDGRISSLAVDAATFASVWNVESLEPIPLAQPWHSILQWPCQIAAETCPWLPKKHCCTTERQTLARATVALSVHERSTMPSTADEVEVTLSAHSIRAAVNALKTHGYCVLSGLLSPHREQCLIYGKAVLSDLRAASRILKEQGIDLYHPLDSSKEPDAYRELSMREDCRMDVRHGPALDKLRGPPGCRPVTIRSDTVGLSGDFLRGHANLLAIVRQVMNPVKSSHLSAGNFGRYNFDGGGPDGSFQPLTAGIVGGIVSLPGSADQAIHADTPHLFEHSADPLPAHYINVFTPGCPAADGVGQTAFVHGSHRLDFVAQYCTNDDAQLTNGGLEPFHPSIWEYLVRPRLNVGDVLLFDCRILHFGLANQHPSIERPLLYTNMTMNWFHDPKNWEQQRRIFKTNDV